MSIRFAVLGTIFLAFALMIAAVYAVSRYVLLPSYLEIERTGAGDDLDRARFALQGEVRNLEVFIRDWAYWDETYEFVASRDAAYLAANAPAKVFVEQGLGFLGCLDQAGALVWGRALDPAAKTLVPLPDDLRARLAPGSDLVPGRWTEQVSGLLRLSGGDFIFSACKIRRTDCDGPPRGCLVMARPLDRDLVREIGRRTRLALILYSKDRGPIPAWVRAVLDAERPAARFGLRCSADGRSMVGYAALPDIHGAPAFVLAADLPRGVFALALTALDVHLLTLGVLGLVFCGLAMFLVETRVVARIRSLSGQVRLIKDRARGGAEIRVRGADELAGLATDIDRMVRDLDDKNAALERLTEDLSEVNRNLYELANTDVLTGLTNRRRFFEELDGRVAHFKRYGQRFCLAMFDVDHFKRINDTFGHAVGDEVLKALSAEARSDLRETDVVGRIGGEEFAVLLPNTSLDAARGLCERLRKGFAACVVRTEAGEVRFSASFGLTEYQPGEAADDLMKRADELLYQAKDAGRNCVRAA
ncbi:MAG: diguanylate cyclase [Desulfovibrionaceae bacterium]|nr:diguanylate cyclase [Desulfovibrionaceae bacterium]